MRACISGIGLLTPIGQDPAAFWQGLTQGTSGADKVRSFDTAALERHVGCEVGEYDLPAATREAVLGGRCTELAVLAAEQAVEEAGIAGRIRGATDVAIVVGTTMGEVTRFEQDRARHPDDEPGPADVRSLSERPLDVIGRSIARRFRLGGPVLTVPAACAAGSVAIGVAASLVSRGKVRAAIAVGSEAFSRLAFVGFSRMRAMSSDCCRPFSRNRPGLLLGEGAGALVIEPRAAANGRLPWGFVDGFGLSCDAHHITGPHPEAEGAVRAMRDALMRAGITPDQVDYVNAHGTGTPLNDRMESRAVGEVFGARAREVPLSSIKSLTGHMMGAAGVVEAIASLLAMRHATIPPTWNFVEADPDCAVDCVPNAPRSANLERVLSNSYAFGGNNASLLLTVH